MTWGENGAFTADTDSVVTFAAVIKTDGDYDLTVQSSASVEAAVGDTAVALDASGKSTQPVHDLGDTENATTITLRVPAGTTVSHVTYMKK